MGGTPARSAQLLPPAERGCNHADGFSASMPRQGAGQGEPEKKAPPHTGGASLPWETGNRTRLSAGKPGATGSDAEPAASGNAQLEAARLLQDEAA